MPAIVPRREAAQGVLIPNSLEPLRQQTQNGGIVNRLRFMFPEDQDDAEHLVLLNQTGQAVAENLAEHFVLHRRIGLAPNTVAKLAFDCQERAFDVAPFSCGTTYFYHAKAAIDPGGVAAISRGLSEATPPDESASFGSRPRRGRSIVRRIRVDRNARQRPIDPMDASQLQALLAPLRGAIRFLASPGVSLRSTPG